MQTFISRVGIIAKPEENHPVYRTWEIANIVVLLHAATREESIHRAIRHIQEQKWEPLSITLTDRLIEERVLQQGGAFLEMFRVAQRNGVAMRIFPKNFGAGVSAMKPILCPRITEQFIDKVVHDVGGTRLDPDNVHRICDYQIDDWIFELKDLQEEGLLKSERQEKLALLFAPYADANAVTSISPDILDDEDRLRWLDIMASPIKSHVASASKQISSTKKLLGDSSLKGGIIFLNTGYSSLPSDVFSTQVERFAKKDSTHIIENVCISTWTETNGMDSVMYYAFGSQKRVHSVAEKLEEAFGKRFEEVMTQLITGNLLPSDEQYPSSPISFHVEGMFFSWQPSEIPSFNVPKTSD